MRCCLVRLHIRSKAIGIAKDQLKAHLLAVRLYRSDSGGDGSYGKICADGSIPEARVKRYSMSSSDHFADGADGSVSGQTPIPVNAPFLLTCTSAQRRAE